jgi:hypothetical protein
MSTISHSSRSDRDWKLVTLINLAARALYDSDIHHGLSVNRRDRERELKRERADKRERERAFLFPLSTFHVETRVILYLKVLDLDPFNLLILMTRTL